METLHYNNENITAVHRSEASFGDVDNEAAASSESRIPIQMQWAMMDDWHNLAYQELLSMNDTCVLDLVNILARIKRMPALYNESADKYEALKIFLEECLKFLALSKEDVLQLSKNKCFMLMTLIKSFLAHFKYHPETYEYGKNIFSLSYLSRIPELQQQITVDALPSNPSLQSESEFNVHACQSQWMKLDDWHDPAHRELVSVRCLYFCQLFKAYNRVCSTLAKDKESAMKYEAVKIFLLEYCKFLTLSRADIVHLSKGECYVFLMLIKNQLWRQLMPHGCQSQMSMRKDGADVRVKDPCSIQEFALGDCTRLYQAEWLIPAHQELESLRNMYSSQLDKLYENVNRLCCQSSESDNMHNSTKAAIGRALDFLSASRADISHVPREDFYEKIKMVEQIIKDPLISQYQCEPLQPPGTQTELVPDLKQPIDDRMNPNLRNEASTDLAHFVQFERFTNLIDQTYEELQLVTKNYYPQLLMMSNILSQHERSLYEKQYRDVFIKYFRLLEMRRSTLSCYSREKYESWVKGVELLVAWSKRWSLTHAQYSAIKQSTFGYREVVDNFS